MGWLWAILTFLNNLWSAWKTWQAARAQAKALEAEKKRQAREKAEADLKQCKTEKECDDAADTIADNSN